MQALLLGCFVQGAEAVALASLPHFNAAVVLLHTQQLCMVPLPLICTALKEMNLS
jgi:hypothetical protein